MICNLYSVFANIELICPTDYQIQLLLKVKQFGMIYITYVLNSYYKCCNICHKKVHHSYHLQIKLSKNQF